MAFTYDLATDTGRVRLLAKDTDQAATRFSDEEIAVFLELEGTVRKAAAARLEAMAADIARQFKSERIGDYQYDQSNSAAGLLEAAKALRAQDQEVAFDAATVGSS